MILTKSYASIQLYLDGAATDVSFGGSYRDRTQNNLIVPGMVFGISAGTTKVDLFPAPPDNVSRLIDDFYVYNGDAATKVVFITYNIDGVFYPIRKMSLTTGQQFQYGNRFGFLS